MDSPIRLTLAEKVSKFCYHNLTPSRWVNDPDDPRRMVCCLCSKPSPLNGGLRNCGECGNEFIMENDWRYLSKFAVRESTGEVYERHVLCKSCNGE